MDLNTGSFRLISGVLAHNQSLLTEHLFEVVSEIL